MSDSEQTIPLSDVAPERARRENDKIDAQFSDYEQQVATLEDEKATLEDKLETEREEKEQLQQVVAQYKDQRCDELVADIRATIERAAVNEDDFDYDFDKLEADADLDTLETVKEAVEAAVKAAGTGQRVDNRDKDANIADVDGNGNDDGGLSEAAQAAADDLGMGSAWEKVQQGERLAEPTGTSLGDDTDSSMDELVAALQEAVDS
jgi:vacuolar-type H+-ATPase subunit I/STV1